MKFSLPCFYIDSHFLFIHSLVRTFGLVGLSWLGREGLLKLPSFVKFGDISLGEQGALTSKGLSHSAEGQGFNCPSSESVGKMIQPRGRGCFITIALLRVHTVQMNFFQEVQVYSVYKTLIVR